MHDPDQMEPFPWAGFFGCLLIIATVLAVALSTGLCTASAPC